MNDQQLIASNFMYSNTFFDKELESVLNECVVVYEQIRYEQECFSNDEECIRDVFLDKYLKDDNYKNSHSPLSNYHFDGEVRDAKGRLDIRVLPINPYKGDKVFYSIECKRIANKNVLGKSGLNAEYIKNGICRYVSEYYTNNNVNAMFGFVVEVMDVSNNIGNINMLLSDNYINQQGKIVNANTIKKMQYEDFANGYPYSYISTHMCQSGKELTLYHLMFDFSQNIK